MPATHTQLTLTNRALQMIGTRSKVAALDEDSNEAIEALKVFDVIRDQVLRAARWNFARKTEVLELLKERTTEPWDDTQPEPPWMYSYIYPEDCIHPRWITSGARFISGTDHDEGERIILTNQANAALVFTLRVEDFDLWDEGARQALVSGLAAFLAIPLTGSLQMAQGQIDRANAHLISAREQDAQEQVVINDHTPDWIAARGTDPLAMTVNSFYTNANGALFDVGMIQANT